VPYAQNLTLLSYHVAARLLTVACVVNTISILVNTAHAQQNGANSVIYTCTDAAGNKITSDRPIASCMDRDQRVLSSQGWLVKVVPPELTDAQRAAQQEKQRQAQLAQQRQRDQQRANEALLTRYPTQAAHDAGRRATLAQTQSLLSDARQQLAVLRNERTSLTNQIAHYAPNSGRAPAELKHDITRNAQAIETQQQFIIEYQAEINRINAQFDAEDKRLQPLWQSKQPASAAAAATQ